MAANPISAIAIQQFRDQYINLYAASRKIMGAAQEIHNVVGDAYKWPRLGNADMAERGAYGSLIDPTTLDHTRITTTFNDYVMNIPVDRGEQTLINVNERAYLARKHAEAYGRRIDQMQIDALNASSATSIPVGTTNLTEEKIIEAAELLNKNNVPFENRYFMVHASQLSSMLKQEKITNSDYVTVKSLMTGQVQGGYMGFNWIVLGDYSTNGLPKTDDNRTCFAWHMDALGLVFKLDPTIDVDWSAERVSWLSISQFIAGSSALQDEGIVKIVCDETK